jgi:hypothetical protein
MLTAGFAGFMILLMFLLKWKVPVFEKVVIEPGIEVQLNLPDEPPQVYAGGGGGGGNPVNAPEPAGTAPPTPPAPGVEEDSRDIETDDNDKDAPEVVRPVNPRPAKHVVENTSVVKATTPKPIENPAPPKPKATLGANTTGNNKGGNAANTYERSGGQGGGRGVGNGDGNGGGTGGGNGGGNGTGSGTGAGPRRVSGSRVVINPKSMDAGENLRGKVFAEIKVSPDGIGTFVRTTRGTTANNSEMISIIREWLRRNKFNKADNESIVVYEFNFLLGG